MYTVQAGPFVLNLEIAIYLIAGMLGMLGMRISMRQHEDKSKIAGFAMNAVLIWLLVWKGSLLLFSPSEVLSNLWSLIYYSGGEKGAWLASTLSASYMMIRLTQAGLGARRSGMLLTVMIFGWTSVYYAVQAMLLDESIMPHSLLASGTFLLFVILIVARTAEISLKTIWLWYGLGRAAVSFMEPDERSVLYGFGAEQLVWLLFSSGVLLLIIQSERAIRLRGKAQRED
ncbi:hypothetical protein H8B09_21595 [Paenibacillus sp. PR3]|uniref:Diacylglyceryl transferase n=1 Tax=Paenibacillus terricola TaxID=2763503 RepID=A0ABR8MZQ7_9BACL|nr:hypothetical protein [Paenibacillus terricola]MBD3921378.1 hypothetical protein [Paenibacillus terricola]